MSIKIRRFLFYVLLLLFFIISPIILAYSSGWRLNSKTWTLQKTGGIFIEGHPNNSQVFINGKKIEHDPNFFQKGVLIANLLPGEYKIEIWQTSQKIWERKLNVSSSLVSGATSIIIPPKEEKAQAIFYSAKSRPIEDFKILNDNNLLWTSSQKEISYDNLTNFSSSSNKEISTKIIGEKLSLSSSDSQKIITSKADGSFFITDPNSPKSSLNLNTLLKQLGESEKILNIFPHPYNDYRWVIKLEKKLLILDTKELTIEKLNNPGLTAEDLKNGEIIWAEWNTTTSKILNYNFLTKNKEVLFNDLPHKFQKIINAGFQILVLDTNNNLYLLTAPNKLQKLLENVSLVVPSPDNKKILVKSNEEFLIYFLEDENQDGIKKIHAKTTLNLPNFTKSDFIKFAWHKKSNHLLIQFNNKLIFIETDDGDPQNYWIIAENIKKFFYDEEKNTLYFLKDNSLYKLKLE